MIAKLFKSTASLVLIVFHSCRSELDQGLTSPVTGDMKAATADILNYDSFHDGMNLARYTLRFKQWAIAGTQEP